MNISGIGVAGVTVIDNLGVVYNISPDITEMTEGETVTYTVSTANVPDGTYYWTNSGTTVAADFTDDANSGSFTLTSSAGTITRTLVNDLVTEGSETIILQLRTGSTGGPIVATAATVTVLDSSTTPVGQELFATVGSFTWTAPAGVTSVSVVCVGGGGGGSGSTAGGSGGGGGGLGWKNSIAVTPGVGYDVVVGGRGTSAAAASTTAGGDSYFISTATVRGIGGARSAALLNGGGAGGGFVGDGGGNGGAGGGAPTNVQCGGGGGAGGYSGAGGNGSPGTANNATDGAGGGGGGGGGGGSADTAGSGGGVGVLGEGANGTRGASTTADGRGGFGGSGGTDAAQASTSTTAVNVYSTGTRSNPGLYGGGCGGSENGTGELANAGGNGAVRIIWGPGRSFPSTNTGDL